MAQPVGSAPPPSGSRSDGKPIGVVGCGSYVPDQVLTNFDLAARLDTSDDWIQTRTGIRERRIAAPDQGASDLALAAARRALADAQLQAEQIDLIVVATCTPDRVMPSVAALLQRELGAGSAAAVDVNAACAGFAYAFEIAHQLVSGGAHRRALVVGAEVMSRTLDWADRSTAVLFGDGAGAVVLGPVERGGIYGSCLRADGRGADLLFVEGGAFGRAAGEGSSRFMVMNGREVYRWAVGVMGQSASEALRRFDIPVEQVALFVPHQANIRIIESAAKHMGLPLERVYVNVERYGNTSAASVPLALDEAYRSGRLRPGDIVVTVGFGAGLTWGANVFAWSRDAPAIADG